LEFYRELTAETQPLSDLYNKAVLGTCKN